MPSTLPLNTCRWVQLWALCALMLCGSPSQAQDTGMAPGERDLKVGFIYNFLRFTEWPEEVGSTLTLCIRGPDPFGVALDVLQGKPLGSRKLVVQRRGGESLKGCHAVFFSAEAASTQAKVLAELRGKPVLTMADSAGAARQGVNLNMAVAQDKVTFEVNMQTARAAKLKLNPQMVHLATEVIE